MERTEPLKLLFVINNLYTRGNGLSASARRTITLLRERGHDVRVLSSGSAEQAQACDFTAPEFALPARRFPLADAIISAQGYAFAKPKRKVIKQAVDWPTWSTWKNPSACRPVPPTPLNTQANQCWPPTTSIPKTSPPPFT